MKVPLIIRVCNHEQCVDVKDHGLEVEGSVVEITKGEQLYVYLEDLTEQILVAEDELYFPEEEEKWEDNFDLKKQRAKTPKE